MSDFIPPRMEHVIIDEETQMQKYLAEIAMEDLLLAGGKRTERPAGLMVQYKKLVAAELAAEAAGNPTEWPEWQHLAMADDFIPPPTSVPRAGIGKSVTAHDAQCLADGLNAIRDWNWPNGTSRS